MMISRTFSRTLRRAFSFKQAAAYGTLKYSALLGNYNNKLPSLPLSLSLSLQPYRRYTQNSRPTIIETQDEHDKASTDTYSKWENEKPQKALVVLKAGVESTINALKNVSRWLAKEYPDVELYVEHSIKLKVNDSDFKFIDFEKEKHENLIDFIITLGGDGTLLKASSLFQSKMPPVLSFSMGTLGFLLPFDIHNFKQVINSFMNGKFYVLNRMRMDFKVYKRDGTLMDLNLKDAMNEVTIHRGHFEHLTTLNIYINDQILTTVVSDGLVLATPSGSTAYSLSAGGPILHPSLQTMVLTPICPRSLSFRSIVLPSDTKIKLELSEQSRGNTTCLADGMYLGKLSFGDYISIQASKYPIPCITLNNIKVNWVHKVNQMLKFNQTFSSSNFKRIQLKE